MKSGYFILGILVLAVICVIPASGCDRNASCQSIQNLTDRNHCYEKQAIAEMDISGCEKIQPEQQDGSGVFIILARMGCYNKIAVLTKNASLCKVYSRYNSASICVRDVAVAKKDSSVCADLDMEKDLCYYRIAILNSDINECEKISDKVYKDKCSEELNGGERFYCNNIGC